MAKLTLLAVLVGLLSPATGSAAGPPFKNPEKAYLRLHEAARDHHKGPGRNIVKHGLPSGKEAPKSKIVEAIGRMWGMLHPKPEPAYLSGPANGHLASIMKCESGGDPTAVSPGGTYRGLYQFDYSTWESVGGTGDPAAATPAEQHYRAWLLYQQRGSAPWPVCQYR